jgi:hypothetical protein
MASTEAKVKKRVEVENAMQALVQESAERYGITAPELPRVGGREQVDVRLALARLQFETMQFTVQLVEAATAVKPSKRLKEQTK